LTLNVYFSVCRLKIFLLDPGKIKSEGDYIFAKYDGKDYLVRYTGSEKSITLPERSEYAIFDSAFRDKGIISVDLGNSVTKIGTIAFMNCTELTEITFGENITEVCRNAFTGCTALKRVNASSLESWCNILFDSDHAINPGKYPETDPEKATSIDIYNTIQMTDATISITPGDQVFTDISDGAVADGTLTIEPAYGMYVSDFLSLKTGVSNPLEIAKALYIDGAQIHDLVIPETVTKIWPFAFINLPLKSVRLHKNVEYVGGSAFAGCGDQTELTVDGYHPGLLYTIGKCGFKNTMYTKHGENLYAGNSDNPYMILVKVERYADTFDILPETRAIATNAFTSGNIYELCIPDGVEVIAKNALTGIYKTDHPHVTFGKGVTYIGSQSLPKNTPNEKTFVFEVTSGWSKVSKDGKKEDVDISQYGYICNNKFTRE